MFCGKEFNLRYGALRLGIFTFCKIPCRKLETIQAILNSLQTMEGPETV